MHRSKSSSSYNHFNCIVNIQNLRLKKTNKIVLIVRNYPRYFTDNGLMKLIKNKELLPKYILRYSESPQFPQIGPKHIIFSLNIFAIFKATKVYYYSYALHLQSSRYPILEIDFIFMLWFFRAHGVLSQISMSHMCFDLQGSWHPLPNNHFIYFLWICRTHGVFY